MFGLSQKRDIYKVSLSHAIHGVALGIISIYIPIFLLTHGYSLFQTILFFIVFHASGLLFLFTILIPLMNNFGLLNSLKLHYPLEILFLLLLNLLNFHQIPFLIVAVIGGMANLSYWSPLNILFIRGAEKQTMGTDLSVFFSMPKVAGIIAPLLSAVLIPWIGFWFVFMLAMVILVISFLPLRGVRKDTFSSNINIGNIFSKMKKRKQLFFLESFDNVLEESEWFWAIFVFLVVGSISAPGIVGSLEALGGAIFTLIVGKYANKRDKSLVFVGVAGISLVWILRMFIESALPAYIITVIASFIMTLFLVSYFSVIYKGIKNKKEEEFLILREIPTTLGRMIVFGVILISIGALENFFFLPILASIILVLALFANKKKKANSVSNASV